MNKRFIFFIVGFILISIVVILFFISSSFNRPSINPPVAPSPKQTRISPLQQTTPGKTTQREVESLSGVTKISEDHNSTIYTKSSLIKIRPNQIIVQNGIVVFERELTPEKKSEEGYSTLSEFNNKFGSPDKKIKGSKFYGNQISTFIYASKGFTLIGNENTDEVYEIQFYIPTSVQNYINTFGSDVSSNTAPVREGIQK